LTCREAGTVTNGHVAAVRGDKQITVEVTATDVSALTVELNIQAGSNCLDAGAAGGLVTVRHAVKAKAKAKGAN